MEKFGRTLNLGAALAMVAAAGLTTVYPPEPRHRSRPQPDPAPRLTSKFLREPNGLSWRSLKRALNSGWKSEVIIKPERRKLYLSSHARQREALLELLAKRPQRI